MTVVHSDMHTRELFLQLTVGLGLGLLFVRFLFMPFCSCVACFCCVRFSLFSIGQDIGLEERL